MDFNKRFLEIIVVAAAITLLVFFNYRSVAPLKPGLLQTHLDQLFHVWVLGWDWWSITHQPLDIFNANIFYPAPNALALADHLLGFMPLWLVGYLISHDFVEAHNYAFLFARIIGGLAAYVYFRRCKFKIPASLVSTAFFVISLSPIIIDEIEQSCFGYAFLIFYLIEECLEKGKAIDFIILVIALLFCWLSGFYFSYMLAIALFLFLAIIFAPEFKKINPKRVSTLFVCFAVSLLLIIPTLLPYYNMYVDGIIPKPSIYSLIRASKSIDDPDFLVSMILITTISLYLIIKERLYNRKRIITFLSIALLFHMLTLGPYVKIGGRATVMPLPYLLLLRLPGFGSIRYFWLFKLMAQVGEAFLLAALLNSILVSKGQNVYSRNNVIPLLIFALLSIVSLRKISSPYNYNILSPVPAAGNIPVIYNKLAEENDDAPVAEFPLKTNMKFAGYLYQYFSLYHRHPIYNGSSGYLPPAYEIMLEADLSSAEWVDYLRTVGVKYIISHPKDYIARIIDSSSKINNLMPPSPPLPPVDSNRSEPAIWMSPTEKAVFINGFLRPGPNIILKHLHLPGIISALPANVGKDKIVIDLDHYNYDNGRPRLIDKYEPLPAYVRRNNNVLIVDYEDLDNLAIDLGPDIREVLAANRIYRIVIIGFHALFDRNIVNPFYGLTANDAAEIGLTEIARADGGVLWRIEPNESIRLIAFPDVVLTLKSVERDVMEFRAVLSTPPATAWKNPNPLGNNRGRLECAAAEKEKSRDYTLTLKLPLALSHNRPYEATSLVNVPSSENPCKAWVYFPQLMEDDRFMGEIDIK